MGLIANLGRTLMRIGGAAPQRSVQQGMRVRAFNAATPDRTNTTWSTLNESSNRELRYNLRNLRARSRDLVNNNEYAAKFVDMCTQNIVGPDGMCMDPQGTMARGKADDATNKMIEDAWYTWARRGVCTIDGQLSWVDAQRVICECVARDGEVLIRPIIGKAARNEFGFAIQIMEADYLDDLYYINNDPGGAGISMGVETDSTTRVVAYHVLSYNPGDYGYSGSAGRTRVPASDLFHVFVPRRGHQRRGVPWMSASMSALFQLGEFKESELVATRVAAGKMGFYTQSAEGAAPMSADDFEGSDDEGGPIQDVEPGTLEKLPFGWDIKSLDWAHPNIQFDQFVKSCLRGSAAGMGVGYNTLASDLEGVNYSSLREGRLETTDLWRNRQRWFSEWVCQPIFSRWLEMAVLTGKVALPQSTADTFRYPRWIGRGWSWVDPQKEAEANLTALSLGLRTRTDILAEQGKDFEETIEQLAKESEQMKAKGLNPDVPIPGKAAAPGAEAKPAPGNDTAKTPPAAASKSADQLIERIAALESKFDSRIDRILKVVEATAKKSQE